VWQVSEVVERKLEAIQTQLEEQRDNVNNRLTTLTVSAERRSELLDKYTQEQDAVMNSFKLQMSKWSRWHEENEHKVETELIRLQQQREEEDKQWQAKFLALQQQLSILQQQVQVAPPLLLPPRPVVVVTENKKNKKSSKINKGSNNKQNKNNNSLEAEPSSSLATTLELTQMHDDNDSNDDIPLSRLPLTSVASVSLSEVVDSQFLSQGIASLDSFGVRPKRQAATKALQDMHKTSASAFGRRS
jgi:hypothetical protein